MADILKAVSVYHSFDNKNEKNVVLQNIDFEIQEGEFVTIMGPSGCGKSTLLYALSGMEKIKEGSVFLDGEEISSQSEEKLARLRRDKIGYIFQQPTLIRSMNLIDNIVVTSVLKERSKQKEIKEKAILLMKKTGISNLAKREINEVSGGQLQRAGICRALMNCPKIIFGDEPTGALNSVAASEILDIISLIHQEGTTILLATHDVKVAARSERVVFMKDGEIVKQIILPKNKECSQQKKIELIDKEVKAFMI